jgi:hypothetical protein
MLPQRSGNVTTTRRSIAAALILTFIGGIDLARADPVAKIPAGPLQQSIARIHAKPLQVRQVGAFRIVEGARPNSAGVASCTAHSQRTCRALSRALG